MRGNAIDRVSSDIRTGRLLLKRLGVEDVTEEYIRWLNDFETTKYLEVRFRHWTRESVEDYVRRNQTDTSTTHHYGIFDRDGARLIGTLTFNHVDLHHLSASVSFVIGHPGTQGRGYATEAVHAATHYMFAERKFIKLWGGYYADHGASERVFLKNGYRIEGRLRKKLINFKNERVDHVYVGILPEEFHPNERYLGGISGPPVSG